MSNRGVARQVLGAMAMVGFALMGSGVVDPSAPGPAEASVGLVPMTIPNPTIHYTFDTDLTDSGSASTLTAAPSCPADPCNSASSFGEDSSGKYWTWTSTNNRGGGFTLLTNANIGKSYTIALKFSFSVVTSWRKIIDYQNRTSDNGFYYYGSKLQFYNGGSTFNSTTTYPAGTVLDLVVVRESTNPSDPSVNSGTFTVYGVGADNSLTQLFQYNDTVGNSIPHVTGGGVTKLGFFYDDTATSSEAAPSGKVYDLRIWSNQSLSSATLSSAVVKPAAPTGVVATPQAGGLEVTWVAVSGATTYLVSAGGQSCIATAPSTSCTISGLTDGTTVTAEVQAIGPGGYSLAGASSPVVVGAPTVTTLPTSTTLPSATTVPSATTLPTRLAKTGVYSDTTLALSLVFVIIGLSVTTFRRLLRRSV